MPRPRVGIFGLTGCAGDQLVLLDCEDELLALAGMLDIRDFLMASSQNDGDSPLEVALVEGCVASRRDEERLRRIRGRARWLVALGACATGGGVPAMDDGNDRARRERLATVYGQTGLSYDSLPPRAVTEVVPVDLSLPGCPVEKQELLALLAHLLQGHPPPPVEWPVCAECRMAENRCLLLDGAPLCCGPLTVGGCQARCPSLGVPCLGCRGPIEDADPGAAVPVFAQNGLPRDAIEARLRLFSARARWEKAE
ncbi:MAG: hypothetical protein RMI94_12760 [Bryobacterales bacterium]|nr:hypothetical protein [Bryobacteraceae bacterium]MDW8131413.1 hypothetical protein [Bryobacterales bacterium]